MADNRFFLAGEVFEIYNEMEDLMTVLPLQKDILYGPINSRRLGKSLGVNLMPTDYKLCSFNCVYCHYGITDKCTIDLKSYIHDLPEFDDIVKTLIDVMKSRIEFDYITFSGNGEPTLYPDFSKLVNELLKIRDKYRPETKIALLSNSSGLIYNDVRECILEIDLPVFKLDAGILNTFKKINRPAKDVDYKEIVDLLSELKGIIVQTVFIDGLPRNTTKEDIDLYFEKIKVLQPKEVHIYSIDRPVPNTEIKRVLPRNLKKLAEEGQSKTGVKIKAFYLK
jgi:wyosine [tRNA(Phe)-imidazoG37] synthetase (radical SAM superfamily)